MSLVPAYNRDYKSKKEVLADWNADKDFIIQDMSDPYNGSYMNKQDAERAGKTQVQIRYQRLTKVAVLKKKKDVWVAV